MPSHNCPGGEELAAYARGELLGQAAEVLAEHLEECPTCETTVAAIESQVDTIFHRLQQPPADFGESEVERVLEKVEANAAQLFDAPTPNAKKGGDLLEMEYVREYQLLEKVGEGGMGAVYKALHTKLDRMVAVKLLPASRLQDDSAVARFEREMKAVGRVDHPNIVRAMDAGEQEGTHYLVMEYVDGQDLNELVRCAGPLPVTDACEMIRQAALVLQCAHEHGLVHRDIKPSNLMITQQGQVKLLDLGLARFHSEDAPVGREVTAAGQTMGAPDYMAPEQIADTHTVDIRADIYALGCTLYKLLAGRPPFSGPEYRTAFDKQMGHVKQEPPPIGRVRMDVSAELVAVIDKMLAKDPEERFATPAEVAEAMEPFAAGCDLPGMLKQAKRITDPNEESLSEISTEDRSSALAGTQPQISPTPEPVEKRGKWKWVAVGAALAGVVALAVILTLMNRYGTLVIECNDPNVQVAVMQGGEEVEVVNAESGWSIRLKSGQYDVELKGSDEQFEIDQDSVVVKRGDEVMVRVTLKRPEVPELEKELMIDLGDGVTMEFVLIPAGEFMMGSPQAERQLALEQSKTHNDKWAIPRIPTEGPQHRVKISKPFYLGKYEVTQAQWEVVMGDNQSKFKGPMNPVEQVSWNDIQPFLAKLNMMFEKKGMRFALPTEAQWEYACRADSTTAFSFGDDPATLTQHGWFDGNAGSKTHPVGQRKPNAWGLYDMRGNVWEWCSDWHAKDFYSQSPAVDPVGPPTGSCRVLRSGCWYNLPRHCRAAFRNYGLPDPRYHDLGFRLALVSAGRATEPAKKPTPGNVAKLDPPELPAPRETWNPPTARCCQAIKSRSPYSIAFTPDSTLFAWADYFGKAVYLWDLVEGETRHVLPHPEWVGCIAMSSDGSLIASAAGTHVRLWEVETGQLQSELEGPKYGPTSLTFSPDGSTLASTHGRACTIVLWDVATGQRRRTIEAHKSWAACAVFNADGSLLASGSHDGTVKLWDPSTGHLRRTLTKDAGSQRHASLAFSPDGAMLASGGDDKTVEIWDVKTGQLLRKLAGHTDIVTSVAFSADGQLLASGSGDKTVKLWDVQTGELRWMLDNHESGICDIAFSPDGSILATGADGKIVLQGTPRNALSAPLPLVSAPTKGP